MPPVIPDVVPKLFAAGTTVKFHRSFGDYPASDGWTYIFFAVGATQNFQQPATINPDGQSFDIVISATTSNVPAGRYTCGERLTNTITSEVVDPNDDQIILNVEQNIATAAAGAYISHIERALPIIEAAIEGRLTADIENYNIGGRAVSKISIAELRKTRGQYRAALHRLKNPGRLTEPVYVAFTLEPENPSYPPTWVDVTGLDS